MSLFNLVKDITKEVVKDMSKDDWVNLGTMGKDAATKLFSKGNNKATEIKQLSNHSPADELPQTDDEVKQNEELYLVVLSEAKEAGEISEPIRKYIDRKREKLGISKERASELENSLVQQVEFSANEMEYIQEFKSCLDEDNEITESERKLLNRIRSKANITEQRAKELEEYAMGKSLSDEEREYYDEVKACYDDDGEITDNTRRLLNKFKGKLNVSESRAAEIENMVENES